MSVATQIQPGFGPDPLIGAVLDERYTIERVHGRGGMSVVYAGVHRELQRAVAIKVLDGEWAKAPEAVELFLLEARTASSLSHPHIVSVSDLGRLPDGRPYLVMPLIAGHDLATLLLREGPQSPRRVANLLKGVASALDFIHAKGLLHRDIKSENLMHVTSENGAESVLVLDFGVASACLPLARDEQHGWCGTPEFMPPEALAGEVADQRGDVYALATVAFELITGSLPFDCEDLDELVQRKTHEQPRTLAQVSGGQFPAALEAVVASGLALSPDARSGSATHLIRELGRAATHMPDHKPKPASAPRRFARNRTLLGTGAALATARSESESSFSIATGVRARTKTTTGQPRRAEAVNKNTSPPAAAARTPDTRVLEGARSGRTVRAPIPVRALAPTAEPIGRGAAASSKAPPPAEATWSGPPVATVRAAATTQAQAQWPAPVLLPQAGSLQPLPQAGSLQPPPAREIELDLDADADALKRLLRRPGVPRWLVYATPSALIVFALLIWGRARPPAPVPSAQPSATSVASQPNVPPAVAPAPSLPPSQPPPAETANHGIPLRKLDEAAAHAPEAAVIPPPEHAKRAHSTATRVRNRDSAGRAPRRKPVPQVLTVRPSPPSSDALSSMPRAEPSPMKAAPPAESRTAVSSASHAEDLTREATNALLRGDAQSAANRYEQALKADASYAPAWRGKGVLLERTGRKHEAVAAFREFLRLQPTGSAADAVRQRVEALER